ncbi:MAG: GNAT family N-acetyltransferase [Pseudomonadota bacterium]|uniref:GNAT family N-acetyltransferase n=1 Tax=Phenylobacterium sp. TaxID=1871053 RepID=UPI0025CBE70B|nr:GNAT family N-acetyltransferase [Phenylobacterium sp.]MBT9470343.1 GNAT family N-acetyltransferase [Phenylobacterium sp.]
MTAKSIQVSKATPDDGARFAPLIAGLIRATGPVSYGYQFGGGGLLERMVAASWTVPDTLFAASAATLATDGDELLGLELGFAGPNFYVFKDNLVALAGDLIAQGVVSFEELKGLAERAEQASYLNAHVPEDVYYLHALSTPERHRGKGAGRQLLQAAITRAKADGYRELQLDVLADNPAVGFYQANGLRILTETRSPDLSRDHAFPSEYRMAVAL